MFKSSAENINVPLESQESEKESSFEPISEHDKAIQEKELRLKEAIASGQGLAEIRKIKEELNRIRTDKERYGN